MASRKPKAAETASLPEKEILDTAADKAAEQMAPDLPETDQTADAVQIPASDVAEDTPAPVPDEEKDAPAPATDEAEGSAGELRLPYRVAYCSGLNLRATPDKDGDVLQVLPAGTEVLATPFPWVSDGTAVWIPVTYGDAAGYVMGQYLTPAEG